MVYRLVKQLCAQVTICSEVGSPKWVKDRAYGAASGTILVVEADERVRRLTIKRLNKRRPKGDQYPLKR